MRFGRFKLAFVVWESLRATWLSASRADLIGAAAVAPILVGIAVAVVRTEGWRGACFAQASDIQQAISRSDENIRAASDGDLAARCAAYRERLTVLDAIHRTACSGYRTDKGGVFASVDAESRFYGHLVEAKCNRSFDPSCSGPACNAEVRE